MERQKVLVTFNKKAFENPVFLEALGLLHKAFTQVLLVSSKDITECELKEASFWLVVGGDGTLNGAVNSLMKFDRRLHRPLCYLPAGTGNDFARSIGLDSADPLTVLQSMIDAPQLKAVTVAGCNDQFMINVATGGLFATITPEANSQMKSLAGRWSYVFSGLSKISERESVRMKINGEETLDVLGFFVGNAPYAGGGVQVAPDANPFDEALEFVAIPEMATTELVALGIEMQKEEPDLDNRGIIRKRVRGIELQFAEEVPINLDGEQIKVKSATFTVHPEAVELHVPA